MAVPTATAPNGISVPRWSLSKPHLKGAVHRQVYSEIELCHPPWARSGEEGLSGSCRRCERRDGGGAQACPRPAGRLFLPASAVCGGDGSVLIGPSLGRQLLTLGFEVRLIPPAHVKPYVRRNKNDAVDAAAICEAAGRPSQRFVPVRSIENQAELMRHRARELLAGQRTAALNALRGHLAEIGVIAPQGVQHAYDLKRLAVDGFDEYGEVVVPDCVRVALRPLVSQVDALDAAIGAIDNEIAMSVKADETAKRLMTVPGVGPVTASAIVATIQDMGDFASGREFAAFLGLTPRQSSTGGKPRLGRVTKMGDRYLRKLLVVGACSTLSHRKGHNDALRRWASGMLERKTVRDKFKLTAVALANKVARIVFVLMTRGGQYDDRPVAA